MASVNNIKIGNTSYDVSPSANGTLTGFTSNDNASPTTWESSDIITISDTISGIFSKLTTMIKNARFIYTKFGTTDFSATGASTISSALISINSGISSRANLSHSHATTDLPVSSSQINSNAYIPTSSLIYSMQETLDYIQKICDKLLPSS